MSLAKYEDNPHLCVLLNEIKTTKLLQHLEEKENLK